MTVSRSDYLIDVSFWGFAVGARLELRMTEVLPSISRGFDIAATGSLKFLCNGPRPWATAG